MKPGVEEQVLEHRVENGVAWLRLNRPDSMNAVNEPLRRALAAAVKQAGSDDRSAILKALETLDYHGLNGTYRFSSEKEPKWAYHQWMDVPFMIIQYTAVNQTPADAAIVYPKAWATADKIAP